jgi:hypothetical protein
MAGIKRNAAVSIGKYSSEGSNVEWKETKLEKIYKNETDIFLDEEECRNNRHEENHIPREHTVGWRNIVTC